MAPSKSMTVSLAEEDIRFLEDEIASGQYTSPSEVIAAGLDVLRGQSLGRVRSIDELRALVEEGERSGATPYASMDEVKREARRRFEARSARSS